MASGYLDTNLVAWQQQGVDYFLADEALPDELSICVEKTNVVQKPTTIKDTKNQQGQNFQTNRQQFQGRQANNQPRQGFGQNQQHSNYAMQNAQKTPVQNTAPQPKTYASAVPFIPEEHWPPAWQERYKKTMSAPVLWTYASLCDDLSGNTSPERRSFMRKLLGDLGHKNGTHTFWPALLREQESELVPNTQVFWSGVQLLKSRAIVAMGQPATKALGLAPNIRPFMHTRHNGCFVVVLRDVDFLINEPEHYNQVLEFLRRSLARF